MDFYDLVITSNLETLSLPHPFTNGLILVELKRVTKAGVVRDKGNLGVGSNKYINMRLPGDEGAQTLPMGQRGPGLKLVLRKNKPQII